MPVKLDGLSVAELDQLIATAKTVREDTRERRRRELRTEIETKLKDEGFTPHEVLGAKLKPAPDVLPPKYADPADPTRTWSGKGRMPSWLQDLTANGRTLDSFLLSKPAGDG